MTALDNVIIFYEEAIGKEEVARCRNLALQTISYREAADRGTDYQTLLTNTWYDFCFDEWRNQQRSKGE